MNLDIIEPLNEHYRAGFLLHGKPTITPVSCDLDPRTFLSDKIIQVMDKYRDRGISSRRLDK